MEEVYGAKEKRRILTGLLNLFHLCYTHGMDIQNISHISLPILKKYRIKKAALFGSVVRRKTTSTSDIDILIDPPAEFSLFDLAGLKVDLEEALAGPVDVVEYESIKPILKDSIHKYAHPIL